MKNVVVGGVAVVHSSLAALHCIFTHICAPTWTNRFCVLLILYAIQPQNIPLAEADPEVAALIAAEDDRQVSGLELIASEVREIFVRTRGSRVVRG